MTAVQVVIGSAPTIIALALLIQMTLMMHFSKNFGF